MCIGFANPYPQLAWRETDILVPRADPGHRAAANLRARRAARAARDTGGTAKAAKAAKAAIGKAIALLGGLAKMFRHGHTSERWSLLGSCQKRLAQVTAANDRIAALEKMRECYGKAFERSAESGTFDSYALLNRLLADTLLELLGAPPPPPAPPRALARGRARVEAPVAPEEWLRRAENETRTIDDKNPSFQNAVPLADIALGRALLQGRLDGEVQQQVIAAYLQAWRRGGSALQFASVLEQIDFVSHILDQPESAHPTMAQLCVGLRAVAAQLRSATGVG